MNGKKLIGMAVALVVLAGIATIQKNKFNRSHTPAAPARKTLLEGIDLNAVSGLEVTQGSNSVALAKENGAWKAKDLSGYPVEFKKLASAIRAMAEVKTGEPMRTGNVAESEFGFGKEDQRTIVLKSAGEIVATVEVGARRNPSDTARWASQYFVRLKGEPAIYLVDYDFRPFSETPEDWIDRKILDVRSSDIVSVKAGDVELKLDGTDWTLADLDPEKEEFQSSEANQMRSALQYLRCESIADTTKSDAEMGFTNAVEYVAQTRDGFTYTATLGGEAKDGERYARFAVAYAKPETPADADEKALEEFQKKCDANAKKTADLDAKLKLWTYRISDAKAQNLTLPRSQLVKEKETGKTEE
jgi:hypothetical protein